LQQGVNPWRGPWPGGCVGQRAFIETPYGPYWITADKQLSTFMEDGVVSVSLEYEAALLEKIADKYISQTEIAYLRDSNQFIDQIVIRGLDVNGNTVVVVHDFNLRDGRSPQGQGYAYSYTGMNIRTFAGAGFTPRQNVFDANGKMRLWAGTLEGFVAQLSDGLNDNGAAYSGDYMGLVSVGPNRPLLVETEFQGDPNWQYSYTSNYSETDPNNFKSVSPQMIPGETSRYGFKMDGEARWVYMRFQLTSHGADGNFDLTDPPYLPLPTYGLMNEAVGKTGAERPEGR
jgi:hypothetical protein